MSSKMNTEDSQNAAGSFDEQKLSALKKQISLTKSQLLQLAYDDEKFILKLQQLNKLGYEAINEQSYNEAVIYLSEAENILQYAASCGKTIERSLIIATLQNEACVYHRVWELDKSVNYIEAIIYNITSFLQNQKSIELKTLTLNETSDEYIRASIYLKNKLQLVFYYLQFCAVSSQNQAHETALSAASKALNIMKEICEEQYNLQRVARKSDQYQLSNNPVDEEHHQLLLQLHNIKQCKQQETQNEPLQKSIQKFIIKAKKTILKFKIKSQQNKQKYPKIQKQLQTFSIGIVMQINPTQISKKQQTLNIKQQLQYIKKVYKAIYISICHFTMATELRLLSAQKFPIDQEMKKQCFEFKTSELHHLIAVITAGLYIPCETAYLDHILNSFKNHYQVDIAQKDSQISLSSETWNEEDDDLIHLETSSLNLKKEHMNQEIGDLISGNKLKNSIRHIQHPKDHVSPEIYGKMKKGMSKNKLGLTKDSQKSLKTSAHQSNFNTPLTFAVERNKSKSKGKNVRKSNLKQSSKSRKKSSRKVQEKVKSPSIHKKLQPQIKKKPSDMKQKKSSQMKGISRSKSKSRKKGASRSRPELEGSTQREKVTNIKNYMATSNSSAKKILPPHNAGKTQRQYGIGVGLNGSLNNSNKMLSNNVYIQRTNNHKNMQQKDKKIIKKQTNSISSVVNNPANAENTSLKYVNLKKNKSPSNIVTSTSQKESRSLKKGPK